jgi:hypothetical protein
MVPQVDPLGQEVVTQGGTESRHGRRHHQKPIAIRGETIGPESVGRDEDDVEGVPRLSRAPRGLAPGCLPRQPSSRRLLLGKKEEVIAVSRPHDTEVAPVEGGYLLLTELLADRDD